MKAIKSESNKKGPKPLVQSEKSKANIIFPLLHVKHWCIF
jgi:hypothetical protein